MKKKVKKVREWIRREKRKVGQNSEEKLTTFFVFAFLLTFFLIRSYKNKQMGLCYFACPPSLKKLSSWILPISKVDPLIPTKDTSPTQGHMRYGKRHRLEIKKELSKIQVERETNPKTQNMSYIERENYYAGS